MLIACAVLAVFSSCKHGRLWFNDNATDTLCVDTFTYAKTDSTDKRFLKVNLEIDYPSPITGPLSASIASWIRGSISKDATPVDTMDGQKVVDYLGDKIFKNYEGMVEEYVNNFEYMANAKFVCKRKSYVSYQLIIYEYTGGAHGMTTEAGRTFSQIDGKQYGWELLEDTASTGFRKMLKNGVRKYFEKDSDGGKITDEELCDLLLLGFPTTLQQLDSFPLPSTPPYFTARGMTFVYQAYEIAPYAAGCPKFTIGFGEIDKYLSPVGKQLLREREE